MAVDYPTAAEPYRGIAEYYSRMNKPAECYKAIDKAVELATDPQLKRACRQDRASFYMTGQRYKDALAELKSLIEEAPAAVAPYRTMADCYSRLKKMSECYAAVDKAVELATDPQLKRLCRQDRASFYMTGQRYDDALAEFQSLSAQSPLSPEPYRCMAGCYSQMGKLAECYAAIDKAVEFAKDPLLKMNCRQERAAYYTSGQRPQDAIAELKGLLSDYPGASQTQAWHVMLGAAYTSLGDNESAKPFLRQAIAGPPTQLKADASLYLAQSLAKEGKRGEALALMDDLYRYDALHLAVTGYVRPAQVLFSPRVANFGNPRRTEAMSSEVYVPVYEEDNVEVTSVSSNSPFVTAELKPSAFKDRPGYFITATLKPGAPIGELKTTITVNSTHPKQPKAEIPVTATILGDIDLSRESFFLGLAKKGEERKASVIVSTVSSNPLKIEKVECSLDCVIVDVAPKTEGKEYAVTATLKPALRQSSGCPIGNIKGEITIHTNDPDQPQLKVPVYAYVEDTPPSVPAS